MAIGIKVLVCNNLSTWSLCSPVIICNDYCCVFKDITVNTFYDYIEPFFLQPILEQVIKKDCMNSQKLLL